MPIGYKVVNEHYKSVAVWDTEYCINYGIGEVVSAKPGTMGILFFDTLYNAQRFSDSSKDKILRVEFKCSDLNLYFKICSYPSTKSLNAFYSHRQWPVTLTMDPPPGTLFARRLTILEEVTT